jgi:hypothetical protein
MTNIIKAAFCVLMFMGSLLLSALAAIVLFFVCAAVAVIAFTAALAAVPVVITLVLSAFAVDSSGEYLGLFEEEYDE